MVTARNFTSAPFSKVHKKIAAGAFMGMFCDGFTLKIAGVYLVYAQQPLNLSSFWMGLIGAGSMFGIFLGSIIAGALSDRIGRKTPYCICMLLAIILALWQYWLTDPVLLVFARFLLGMIIGADYAVAITLLSEWAPEQNRAKITGCLLVVWMFGYCGASGFEFFIPSLIAMFGPNAWRLILCTSAVPAFICLMIRIGSPESPLWLQAKNRSKAALAIIQQRLGTGWTLPQSEEAATIASGSWGGLFAPRQWRKTTVSCVFYFAQVLPFYAISIFLPLVLAQIHIENPHVSGALYNIFTLAGVFCGYWLYTTVTRRVFLISTFYLACALLSVIIVWQAMPPMLAIAMVTAFALVMAAALVPEFSYPAELFPTELRATGVGLTVAVGNIGAGIGTFLLPVISSKFGIYAALCACAAVLLLGGIICQIWTPATPERG